MQEGTNIRDRPPTSYKKAGGGGGGEGGRGGEEGEGDGSSLTSKLDFKGVLEKIYSIGRY